MVEKMIIKISSGLTKKWYFPNFAAKEIFQSNVQPQATIVNIIHMMRQNNILAQTEGSSHSITDDGML